MNTNKYFIKIWIFLLCSFCTVESFAQERAALIIGNSEYQEQSLKNPPNDANDISEVLGNLGFDVDLKLNANQKDIEDAVQRFGEKLKKDTVGLFYFSGHGVQYEGSNYLIPIGAMSRVSAPDHLRYKTVDVGYVLSVMKQAKNRLNIVVIDACRNSPFKSFSRSMSKGLTRISGAEGTIIAYSTSPGKVALDGSGKNSPYTMQLIDKIQEPNLPIELMFKKVRRGVRADTGGKQSPWYEASIDGDFYFKSTTVNEEQTITHPSSASIETVAETVKQEKIVPEIIPRKENDNKIKGSLIDSRDGESYEWVIIGENKWMSENVAYDTGQGSYPTCKICDKNDGTASSEGIRKTDYISTYGRLYTWKSALSACPKGWRLPTKIEWEKLIRKHGGTSVAGRKMSKNAGDHSNWGDWNKLASNDLSFSALPAGRIQTDRLSHINYMKGFAFFWSSTESSKHHAYAVTIQHHNNEAKLTARSKNLYALSVRCIAE